MGSLLSCLKGGTVLIVGTRRLVVKKRLAEGGFSLVDLVEDARSGRQYAAKRISCPEEQDVHMAVREFKLYTEFDHDALITLVGYDVRRTRNMTEVIGLFPLYTCGTLQDKIEKLVVTGGHFSEYDMLKIFKTVCLGIRQFHTHEPPMCHRDIKLHNVLLAKDGHPVVMDFGSASNAIVPIESRKDALKLQDQSSQFSSMPYRAPELVEVPTGVTIDTKTDVWALGCLLYALAYHETPFEVTISKGGSLPLAIAQGKYTIPEDDPYSQEVKDLIDLMLQLDPADRPNIDELLNRVDALCPS